MVKLPGVFTSYCHPRHNSRLQERHPQIQGEDIPEGWWRESREPLSKFSQVFQDLHFRTRQSKSLFITLTLRLRHWDSGTTTTICICMHTHMCTYMYTHKNRHTSAACLVVVLISSLLGHLSYSRRINESILQEG